MEEQRSEITRRGFVSTAAAAGTATLLPPSINGQTSAVSDITLRINGQDRQLSLEPRVSLLDALREQLQLTGTKKGCDHGQCGACTVLIDGRQVNSCLSLAIMQQGKEITTIEGLAKGEDLHAMQAAFIEYDGLQCGYCTPGQICSAVAVVEQLKSDTVSYVTPDVRKRGPVEASDEEIRERMSGNICRCGAYPNIVAAVRAVHQAGVRS